jgi:hypothetical protein
MKIIVSHYKLLYLTGKWRMYDEMRTEFGHRTLIIVRMSKMKLVKMVISTANRVYRSVACYLSAWYIFFR